MTSVFLCPVETGAWLELWGVSPQCWLSLDFIFRSEGSTLQTYLRFFLDSAHHSEHLRRPARCADRDCPISFWNLWLSTFFFLHSARGKNCMCLSFNTTPISVLLLHLSIFPLVLRACSYTLALMCDIVLDVNLSSSTAKKLPWFTNFAPVVKEVLFRFRKLFAF